jgi:hypothetical protein
LLVQPAPADNAAMEAEPSKAEPPKRKRRWFQFSLRTLMIVVTLLAVAVAGAVRFTRDPNTPILGKWAGTFGDASPKIEFFSDGHVYMGAGEPIPFTFNPDDGSVTMTHWCRLPGQSMRATLTGHLTNDGVLILGPLDIRYTRVR